MPPPLRDDQRPQPQQHLHRDDELTTRSQHGRERDAINTQPFRTRVLGMDQAYRELEEWNEELGEELQILQSRCADLEETVTQVRKRAANYLGHYREMEEGLLEERETSQQLRSQLISMKATISVSSQLNKQFSDEQIQSGMEGLYSSIRDWALQLVMQEKLSVKITNDATHKLLVRYVPCYRGNSMDDQLYACLAIISSIITDFVQDCNVFGNDVDEIIQAATGLYKDAIRPSDSVKLHKKKQWLILTEEFLSHNANDSLAAAKEQSLEYILSCIHEELEAVTTLELTQQVRDSLFTSIAPYMETLRLLHYQETEFHLKMLCARADGESKPFASREMVDIRGEEHGLVEASIFPVLYKFTEDETKTKVVVSKAKVAIA